MADWAFITDFDGTISSKDFYWMMIDDFYANGKEEYEAWQAGKYKDRDFLQHVFNQAPMSESKLRDYAETIPFDQTFKTFANKLANANVDLYVVSAGADFYIKHFLTYHDIPYTKLYANDSAVINDTLTFQIDEQGPYFSDRYGIDKKKVVKDIQSNYSRTYYFGDSEPDSHPSEIVTDAFARDKLVPILSEKGVPFTEVSSFEDIYHKLRKKEAL
ncbi:MtnX-like HAD-IB family phosphatase [Paenalkalicoccus suaedae]|uniref:MtnX-like HAD-IB family phosphatase n=1 Tax=Paenalkalicoccus suaedae TaxID=2592382 RepID=A0A859FDI4_9BACI|nr:MtnX-like HAD-IB family phosphatase [Paenalkalicoccus suaedae]QKS71269.1 MtnX-like HAD-IB family phosphatase [Paenalkalicoccus suaedae]